MNQSTIVNKLIINPYKELLTGLFNPTKISLTICIITAISFTVVFYWHAESIIAENFQYLAHTSTDSYVFATGEVLNFSRQEHNNVAVVALGASALREVTMENRVFKNMVSKYSGVDFEFHRMISSSQSILESAAIVKRLAPSFKGVILLEVNPIRMVNGKRILKKFVNKPRLGFYSPLIYDNAKLLGLKINSARLWYHQDSVEMILSRLIYLVKNLFLGPVSKKQHQYWGMSKKQNSIQEENAKFLSQFLLENQQDKKFSFEVLRNLHDFLKKNKAVKIVLLESPVNPDFMRIKEIRPFYEQHWLDMQSFSLEHGISYLKLEANDHFSSSQFHDWFHANDKAVAEVYSDELAQRIGDILNSEIKENINNVQS